MVVGLSFLRQFRVELCIAEGRLNVGRIGVP
jgi:hypothetical protein